MQTSYVKHHFYTQFNLWIVLGISGTHLIFYHEDVVSARRKWQIYPLFQRALTSFTHQKVNQMCDKICSHMSSLASALLRLAYYCCVSSLQVSAQSLEQSRARSPWKGSHGAVSYVSLLPPQGRVRQSMSNQVKQVREGSARVYSNL